MLVGIGAGEGEANRERKPDSRINQVRTVGISLFSEATIFLWCFECFASRFLPNVYLPWVRVLPSLAVTFISSACYIYLFFLLCFSPFVVWFSFHFLRAERKK